MEIKVNIGAKFPEITGNNSDEFASELMRLEDADFEEVILDFSGTESINSMAMGSIFATYQKLMEQDRKLKLINVNDSIKRLFKVANLTDIIE